MTGLQRENVTKYAALSRNRCIIDAPVGSSSFCLSAQGRNLSVRVSRHQKDEAIQKDGTTADFIFADVLCDILCFFPTASGGVSVRDLLVKWLNTDIGKKGL